jgi:multidrug efflux pump subunit AcrA (membrane-fusion protein)
MTINPKDNTKPKKKKNIWRVFLVLVLIVMIAGVGHILYKQRNNQGASGGGTSTEEKTISVVTTMPLMRNFERVIAVQGNIEAKNFAMVSPRIPGTIVSIFVDEGDTVTANETMLFQTDAANLKENVEIERHKLTVAKYAKQQANASLEKTKADLHKTKLDYERFKRLLEKHAVTADAFEQQESEYLQLQAAEKLAQAQVNLTAAQQEQAEAALVIAQKNLADATIYAPISGNVSTRLLEPGEMGSPGVPVLRIDDTTVVEVSAFLPAQYYADVVTGQTVMKIQAAGIDIGQHFITYKSPTIHPKLRTFEIKCLLTNPPERIAPGSMAQISVILESRETLGVPSAAIQQRGGSNVIFIVKDNISHLIKVLPGIEMDGWTEIREGKIAEDTAVVTMGQDMIEEGTRVTVQKEEE